MGPTRTTLPDGRQHWLHGPIELVIQAEGPVRAVQAAHDAAWARFQTVLQELVDELPLLRTPVSAWSRSPVEGAEDAVGRSEESLDPCPLRGPVARRMAQACAALPVDFITPMAAVAGAVAQEILIPYAAAGLTRASVNNGGDIALHLSPGAQWRIGAVADIDAAMQRARHQPDGAFTVHATDPVRGVATSGWRGRSHSMGLADAVTVLAATAAQADAAATVLANAVNLDHPGIARTPACDLRPDSDLGSRPVTTGVPRLAPHEARSALQPALALARHLQVQGLIHAAVLVCQGQALALEPAGTLPMAA